MKFKVIDDLTSDVYFEIWGKNLKELFENAALAMSSIICEVDKINPIKSTELVIKAENEKELLFSWLQEIIAAIDTEELFYSKFNIWKINNTQLKAVIYGEPVTQEKGETVVKAVTNYKFSLQKIAKGYKATVSVDI